MSALIFLYVVLISSAIEITGLRLSTYDYHTKIGIPVANRIREAENKIFESSSRQRIVSGSYAAISEVPYQAGLVISLGNSYISVCGGSLITETHVLTAAHCYNDGVKTAQSMTVVLGSAYIFYGGLRIDTRDVVVNPEWNPSNVFNDIALVIVTNVEFTDVIRPISLPEGVEVSNDYSNYIGVISGYGLISNNDTITLEQRLSWANITIISIVDCRLAYGPFLPDTNICSGGDVSNPCYGDSGGPLAVDSNGRRILVGIVSFGSELGCEGGLPSAYTRVTSYIHWILSNINEL